jgi:hypothetical protein
MVGKVYGIPPQPPVEENTRKVSAGAVVFGVEYRDLDPEGLIETYKDNAAYLAEMLEESPEGGFTDEGVSIHVWGADDGHEYLRFDMFDAEPHYHYVHRSADVVNNVIEYDVAALGDMLPWVVERLRTRLPDMLTEAGAADVAGRLDPGVVNGVIDEIERMAVAARRQQQALRPQPAS